MKVLFLGTSSGAGKTTVCAMVCRRLAQLGMDPVPFKGSNLSLNSYATADGGEIGMGQAFQAWSAGIEPSSDMNPVLLKPAGRGVMQLILDGKPCRDLTRDSPLDDKAAMEHVTAALGRLESEHGIVICEGSGSPAEINLLDHDIANTGLMRATGTPAVLVADIDRGGVFAALYGTWRIVPDDVRPLLKGFIINRFRGDASILKSGIERIESLTGMRCLGILPYEFLRFPEEDSLSFSEGKMEGSDPRAAFMSNLDEMVGHALESGFDFDGIIRIAEGDSSSRCHPNRADRGILGQNGVHGDGAAVDQVEERIGAQPQSAHGILDRTALHRMLLPRDDDLGHDRATILRYIPIRTSSFDAENAVCSWKLKSSGICRYGCSTTFLLKY